ncbi:hypothetical protein [Cytobacillus gottheilii]|uniref:hypothetical protein n=1 Tax=Cytobacillus gottheilii TaxID=859144 RepID=UPI0009BC6ECA|nr:hypothetical protein [Cytobacillus gottheilii]
MEVLMLVAVAIIAYFLINGQSSKDNDKQIKNTLIANQNKLYAYLRSKEIYDCKKYISNDYQNGIVFDEKNNEILFISKKFTNDDGTFEYNYNKYKANQVFQSEIIVDDKSIYKTQRGSQLLGAAVGGFALGGIGAIIGGLSGNKTKETKVRSIQLKVSIADTSSPSYKVKFLSNVDPYTGQIDKNGYSTDSSKVKAALNHIERWQGIMDIIIKQQNKVANG